MHDCLSVWMDACMYVGTYVCMYACIYVCSCMYVSDSMWLYMNFLLDIRYETLNKKRINSMNVSNPCRINIDGPSDGPSSPTEVHRSPRPASTAISGSCASKSCASSTGFELARARWRYRGFPRRWLHKWEGRQKRRKSTEKLKHWACLPHSSWSRNRCLNMIWSVRNACCY